MTKDEKIQAILETHRLLRAIMTRMDRCEYFEARQDARQLYKLIRQLDYSASGQHDHWLRPNGGGGLTLEEWREWRINRELEE